MAAPAPTKPDVRAAGTLMLRVEGPAAIEIQHLADVICERVNRFLGWRAVERIALRQAPHPAASPAGRSDPPIPERPRASPRSMPEVGGRRSAGRRWRRLGAAIKRTPLDRAKSESGQVEPGLTQAGRIQTETLAKRRAAATFVPHDFITDQELRP